MDLDILVSALAILGFAVLSGRLAGTAVTMPMLFTAAGLLLGQHGVGLVDLGLDSEGVSILAEATLVVVLFTDASRIHLGRVLSQHSTAVRLLAVGMPLAMLIGAVVAWLLLPELSLIPIALLAISLAPTDAALGQSFVDEEAVPLGVRQTLNVESGLNDGLALPFLLVALDLAGSDAGGWWSFVSLFAAMVGLGTALGALTGWLGGRLLVWSAERDWTTPTMRRLGTLSLAAIAYAASEAVGGNGFVAAFVAGLTLGTSARSLLHETTVFAEAEGQLLALMTFAAFGAVVAGDVITDLTWQIALYAVASLVVVRPLAVAISLVGSGLSPQTVGFLGWAGPRGLASVVYAVLIVDTAGVPGSEEVFTVAAGTVILSIALHGLSAAALSRRYGAFVDQHLPEQAPERRPVEDLPLRLPRRRHSRGTPDSTGAGQ